MLLTTKNAFVWLPPSCMHLTANALPANSFLFICNGTDSQNLTRKVGKKCEHLMFMISDRKIPRSRDYRSFSTCIMNTAPRLGIRVGEGANEAFWQLQETWRK